MGVLPKVKGMDETQVRAIVRYLVSNAARQAEARTRRIESEDEAYHMLVSMREPGEAKRKDVERKRKNRLQRDLRDPESYGELLLATVADLREAGVDARPSDVADQLDTLIRGGAVSIPSSRTDDSLAEVTRAAYVQELREKALEGSKSAAQLLKTYTQTGTFKHSPEEDDVEEPDA